jgi:hypothetical protein
MCAPRQFRADESNARCARRFHVLQFRPLEILRRDLLTVRRDVREFLGNRVAKIGEIAMRLPEFFEAA